MALILQGKIQLHSEGMMTATSRNGRALINETPDSLSPDKDDHFTPRKEEQADKERNYMEHVLSKVKEYFNL